MDVPLTLGPTSVAAFIVFIGVLIFVHELGHFLVAKYFDIKVTKFSLGFGPPLVKFERGETTYQVAIIPLGGFVKMVGDSPLDEVHPSDESRTFTAAPVYQRALIALAGPAFNLFFPVLCFFAYNVLGPSVVAPVVGELEIGQPADRAGFQTGDRIVEFDGERIFSFSRLVEVVSDRPGKNSEVVVKRGDTRLQLHVTPKRVVAETPFGAKEDRGMIGVSQTQVGTRVGVESQQQNRSGFRTGDRLYSVGSTQVEAGEDLLPAFSESAGKKVPVTVGRPRETLFGDIFALNPDLLLTLTASVPKEVDDLGALGLGLADNFVRRVPASGAAYRAGLRAGDRLVEVDGREIRFFWSFLAELKKTEDRPLSVKVLRNGKALSFSIKSDKKTCIHQVTGRARDFFDPGLGVSLPAGEEIACAEASRLGYLRSHWSSRMAPKVEKARLSLWESLVVAVRETRAVVLLVAEGIFKLLSREISVDNVGGPIQLFRIAAIAAELGMFAYLRTLALISVNLGLINLLPIPIFDGGHLLFCAIEGIRRKPLSLRAREIASLAGLAALILLMLLALRNDIMSLGIFS